MWMYKRKFKVSKKGKAQLINEMDSSVLTKFNYPRAKDPWV